MKLSGEAEAVPEATAAPKAAGAGVPAPPDGPAPALNRQGAGRWSACGGKSGFWRTVAPVGPRKPSEG